jgi:hypothetical protein
MADEDKVVYLVAAKGFSANGATLAEGEYVSDQFDAQTIKVLKGMGRLVETDVPPGAADEPELDLPNVKKRGKKVDVGDTGNGLPGLPGT